MNTTEQGTAAKAFEAGVRRARRLIAKLAENLVTSSEARAPIDALYRRVNDPELRANSDAQQARFELLSELTRERLAAEEKAYELRISERSKEIARLTIEIARSANERAALCGR